MPLPHMYMASRFTSSSLSFPPQNSGSTTAVPPLCTLLPSAGLDFTPPTPCRRSCCVLIILICMVYRRFALNDFEPSAGLHLLYKLIKVRRHFLFAVHFYFDASKTFPDSIVAIPGVDRCGFVAPSVGALLTAWRLVILLEHLRSESVSHRDSAWP